jgi:NAD(P)-dependent dehydrogenase (short-subunit alcohol dehydrogenase family)
VTRTAIVTGASSGIGRATALALSEAGWWVLATGRNEARGREVAEALAERSGGDFLAAELTDDETPERLVVRALDAGPLEVLVNHAGIHFAATVVETSPEDFDRLVATNVRSAFLLARAAIPAMVEAGGGVVVNVGSEAGLVAVGRQVAYNVSKAALAMLTKSIAVDHAKDGVRAVTVCPGTTLTPLVERAIASAADPEAHERWLASSRPAQRLGKPEEIAAAIVFLAGERASFITGSELVIDGGYTAA